MADQINPDRILNALQDLEGLASGDLVVSYVLVMRTAVRDDPDADAYRVAYPRRTPAYSWCAITRNQVPARIATAAYSQPVVSASARVAPTVSQV